MLFNRGEVIPNRRKDLVRVFNDIVEGSFRLFEEGNGVVVGAKGRVNEIRRNSF